MAWTIEVNHTADKDLKKLDKTARQQVLKYLNEKVASSTDPRKFGKPLKGKHTGLWRYRSGDFRILTKIIDKKVLVLVVKVDHRSRIYR